MEHVPIMNPGPTAGPRRPRQTTVVEAPEPVYSVDGQRYGPLILEGTDRSGKDSVLEALRSLVADRLTVLAMHNTKPTGPRPHRDAVARYGLEYQLAAQAPVSTLVVINRGHLSEAVYGSLYRGGAPEWSLPEMFLPPSAVIVLLEREAGEILATDDGDSTFEGPGGAGAKAARLRREQDAFRRALSNSSLPNQRKLLVQHGTPQQRAAVILSALEVVACT